MSGKTTSDDPNVSARQQMVEQQLRGRGLDDERVLNAMRTVPRHAFAPPRFFSDAYRDGPIPIELDQTISQPYTVAFMVASLELTGSERVLEIGTGSGYGAAVLAECAGDVWTVERLPALAVRAKSLLAQLGYDNVRVIEGDGTLGLPQQAPFDAICVTAGTHTLPATLAEQLAPGGRLVIPVGAHRRSQTMQRIRRLDDGTLVEENLGGFAFVPLIGEFGWNE